MPSLAKKCTRQCSGMSHGYTNVKLFQGNVLLQSVQKEPSHQDWVMDNVRHVQLTVRGLELLRVSVRVSRTTTELLMRGRPSPVHVRHDIESNKHVHICSLL